MKGIVRRFLSLALCMCMVFTLLPTTVFAAKSGAVTGLADENIGLSFTGDADNAWSATGTQIIGKARSTSGSGCSGGSDYRSTLTITNKKTTTATLSFDYTVVVSEGTILVDNATTTTAGSFHKELTAGGTVEVEINSGSTSADTKITMTNVKLVADVSTTVTFQPAENGSYTVDGEPITGEYSSTQSSMNAYRVAATPDVGFQFMGWYDETHGEYISTSPEAELNIESDCTITARFASENAAIFEVGKLLFDDLNDAIEEAQKNLPAVITLVGSGTIADDYIIPSEVTLLIPFDEYKVCYRDTPSATTSTAKAKPFRTLTMAESSSITLENGAAISVGGQYFAAGGGQEGKIVGTYGFINMESGSTITVKNGANLYAWGFVSGDGSVTVESGGSVYEWYQIMDFRGGRATSSIGNSVFPFSQYTVQNIEVPLTLYANANEVAYAAVTANSRINTTSISFVGETGLFKLVSGIITKAYDGSTDRIIYTVDGVAEVNNLKLTMSGLNVNSSSYVLPFTNNMTVDLTSGSELTVNQTAALLPGVEVTVEKNAELIVPSGKSLYLYDVDEWGGYCGVKNVTYIPVPYAPGMTGKRAPLEDAKIDINGTMTAVGNIYTTASGADICSSGGSGVYIQQGAPGKETKTYQYEYGKPVVAHQIPITAAKLHNANGTYTETQNVSAGTTIPYLDGVWGGAANITVDFDANGGEGTMPTWTGKPNTSFDLPKNTFTREGYSFTGWNTGANGDGKPYSDQNKASFAENTTLYAQWTVGPVITFVANDGEGTMGTQTVKPNEATALTANSFTRADYDFTGWNTAKDGTGTAYADKANITTNENVTLYAQWTLHKYHVRWLNWDNKVLQEGDYTIEDTVSYEGDLPERPEDDDYTYKFKGWVPYDGDAPMDIHKDTDYKAQFNQFKKLTVTFDANGGNGTMSSVKIVPNSRYTLPECGFTRGGYDFAGWLITGTVGYDTFETYELHDEKWDGDTLFAFSNLILKASWEDNHSLTEVRDSREPTCTEEGYTGDTVCSVCGTEIKKGEVIPALGHSWSEWTVTTPASCTATGEETRTCDRCAATEKRELAKTGHTEVIDQAVEATCTATGLTEGKHCSVCHEVIVAQNEIPATGHKAEKVPGKAATCTEAGLTDGEKCSVCGAVIKKGEVIPAKGHSWDEGKITIEATCENAGVKTYTCTVCRETKTEVIPATGHTEVIDPAVEATCTEPGKTEGKHCSVCNAVITAQEVIPAKGHTEVIDPAVEATCTKTGKTAGKHCSVCNEITVAQEVIPAKGHTEVVDPAVEATCTKTGKTAGKHCSVCHAVIVAQEVVPMKEHTAVPVPGKAATCTEAGLTDGEKCSVCGEELKAQEPIKALGHSWDEGKVTTAPTYEKTGVKTYTCGICKATKTESIPQLVNSGSGSSGGGSNKTTTYPVNITTKTEDNGTTRSSSKMASKGNMVTITVEPDRYYLVDEVIVRDSKGKQLPVKDNGDGTYTFEMPADKVMVEPTFSWVNPFVDVKNTAYYTSAVEWTLKHMITQGTTDITFTPNGSCTRAHIVTFLWRAAGSPEPKSTVSFADVPAGSYYAKAVAWAVENGITLGTTDVTFSPNAACTRAQSMTFLYRASEASASGAPAFYDVAADAYYAAAVKWATDNGITNGIGNGLFGSNNTCTRAQIVTFLWRSYAEK